MCRLEGRLVILEAVAIAMAADWFFGYRKRVRALEKRLEALENK